MRKPTINQQKWKAILAQTEKALAEITKVTGEAFDLSAIPTPRPKRITERAISRLKEQQVTLLRKKVEDIIRNKPIPEVEELLRKIRTREEYIRHPRISKKKETKKHPLTAAERSARSKKAWETRKARMTPEQYEQYGKNFAKRMKKAREAKDLERKGFVAPPEVPVEPISSQDLEEIFGTPLTPDEAEQYYRERADYVPSTAEIVDYQIEQLIADADFPNRTNAVRDLIKEAKERLGLSGYYRLLEQHADDILKETYRWLNYKDIRRASDSLNELTSILSIEPLDLQSALERSTQFDNEMDEIE